MNYRWKVLLALWLGSAAVLLVVQQRARTARAEARVAYAASNGLIPRTSRGAPATFMRATVATSAYQLAYAASVPLTFRAWFDPSQGMQLQPQISRIWLEDVTGDRRTDVVMTVDPFADGIHVVVLPGLDAGRFGTPVDTSLGMELPSDRAFALANLDGTSGPELAFVEDALYVVRFTDTGSARMYRLPLPTSVARPALALIALDLDHDARADLALLGPSVPDKAKFQLDVLRNAGAVGFSAAGSLQFGTWVDAPLINSGALAAGDFNGDGRVDLTAAWATNDRPPEGANGPAFAGGVEQLRLERDGRPTGITQLGPWTAQHRASSLSAGDLDGDGRDDLVAFALDRNASLRTILFRQRSAGAGLPATPTWLVTPDIFPPHLVLQQLQVFDVDGDLKLDVAAALGERDHTPRMADYLQDAAPLRMQEGPDLEPRALPVAPAVGHANEDACADRVVATEAGVDVYLGSGCATRARPSKSIPHPAQVLPGG